jgi:hypothetical protein
LRLVALCFAANDPARLETFWTAALSPEPPRFALKFEATSEPKRGKNRIHLDLNSTSVADQRATVDRLVGLGATQIDIGQGADADHFVLADPEGNEFCVVQPGNFVSDGGFVGSITCDASGSDVGYFWRDIFGWPLVWDQDDETALRAPEGYYITWGPPLPPKHGQNRLWLELAGETPGMFADPDGNEFRVV